MQYEEASRVIPILMTTPVFVLVFATAFLSESFYTFQYLGIFLLVAGAILISLKRRKKISLFRKKTRLFFSAVAGTALLSTLAYAARNILTKYAITGAGPFSIFLWMGLGALITSGILFGFHHPKITKKSGKGMKYVIITKFLSAAAMLMLTVAISQNSVSLPSAIASVEALFVFIIAVILSRYKPKIIREELKESTLLLKLAAIILILAGSFLIV